MKLTVFKVTTVAVVTVLTGCKTLDERLDECQSHGVSRDICYQEERADRRSDREHADERYDRAVRNAEAVKNRRKHSN